uniref:C-type lectin domain-containing protein n=1 Tax=Moorena producens (strain JHB) TaxID=1454205 RepID=A0A1D9FUR0_MOOP1|nr:M10 family metallopeptidase C-terminal domain-containing protein [Moorena producens]
MATPTSKGKVSNIKFSGIHHIDSLLGNNKWGGSTGKGVNLTYSFGEWGSSWYKTNYGDSEPWSGFSPLTSIQRIAAENALKAWSEVANINFTKVIDSKKVAGDIRFAKSSKPNTAWAYFPYASTEAGDIWFSHSNSYNTATKGTYGYQTFLHEIGHALGLKHPHEKDGSGVVANLNIDTTAYTVMSYRSYVNQPLSAYSQKFFPTTPMLHDIAAIQYIYGANMNTRKGNTVYKWAPGQQILETIWDAGGNDTIDWSNQSSNAKINLNAGQWSELGPAYWNGKEWESRTLAIAYGVTIENGIGGSGNDTIYGNNVANVLQGGEGNDYLSGGSGNDFLSGGTGSDRIYGGSGNDNLYGSSGNDTLSGSSGNDLLSGSSGNDYLHGGTGSDRMYGGSGNDRYVVDTIGDRVVEYTNQGIDRVYASITYQLGAHLENLTLTGTSSINGYGNDFNNVINGNSASNYISGGRGNDTVNGSSGNDLLSGSSGNDYLDGGTGSDRMYGGSGNDRYVVDTIGDRVVEYANQGIDRVYASITYQLGAHLENLTLTGTSSINGYGNDFNNVINGNSASNYIWGGRGNDTVNGGNGDDIIYGDYLTTWNGHSYILSQPGTWLSTQAEAQRLGGNLVTINNAIEQSWLNTTFGTNELFWIGLSDRTIEGQWQWVSGETSTYRNWSPGEPNDYRSSSIPDGEDYAAMGWGNQAWNDLQNYPSQYLRGIIELPSVPQEIGGNDNLYGGAGNDRIYAGAGDDILYGGTGNDVLSGGAGADKFVFNITTEGIDYITDFVSYQGDKLQISASGFGSGLVQGILDVGQFVLGAAALDTNDRFIYDRSSGLLSFDADGSGTLSAVQVANFSNKTALKNSDILIV